MINNQAPINKQLIISNEKNIKTKKGFDLEERTFNYTKNIRDYCDKLSKTITNI